MPDYDILSVINRLESEAELKKWADIYISGDTNLHPHIVEMISESMISASNYKGVVEVGAHHCVVTRYLAIHNPQCKFWAFTNANKDIISSNVSELSNVVVSDVVPSSFSESIDLVIINAGLSGYGPGESTWGFNIAWNNKCRLLFCGYEMAKKRDILIDWINASPTISKIYDKMDSILIRIN